MNLEQVTVQLRPRNIWQSIDLGLAMVRNWWRPVYTTWSALTLPVLLLLVGTLEGFGLLVFWWLLPLFETAVLFTVSRAVFGATPKRREILSALPRLWGQGRAELLAWRLHPARVFYLPIGQLEGLSGKERRRRGAVLTGGQEVSALLLGCFLAFEIGLTIALVILITMVIPSSLGADWEGFFERFLDGSLPYPARLASWLVLSAALVALHPMYVTVGFSLYLNRRTQLEGWDLEIAFRRLAQRARAASPAADRTSQGSSLAARAVAILLLLASAGPEVSGQASTPQGTQDAVEKAAEAPNGAEVNAETEPSSTAITSTVEAAVWHGDPDRDPRRLIAEIMTRPELQREETRIRWRLREDLLERRDSGRGSNPALVWLARGLALLGEPFMWLLAILILLLLLRATWRYAEHRGAAPKPPSPSVQQIAGLDVRAESLPDDIAGQAAQLWRGGRPAEALSLLYRGALSQLVEEGLELRESFTEDDCLRSATDRLDSGRLEFFAQLTRAWQLIAYAHRPPVPADAERLWSTWRHHFRSTA